MLSWCNLEWHHMHASCRWSQGQWIVLWNSQNRQSLLWNQWAVSGSGYTTWFSHPESCQLRKEFPLACVQDTGNMSPRFGLFLPSVSLIVFVIQTNMVSPKQETLTVCVYGSRSGDNWLWIEKQANHPSLSFPDSSDDKESACNAGDLGSVPGWEDPLEKRMATHSNILPFWNGEFHRQRSLVGYSPWGHRVGHKWATATFNLFQLWISYIHSLCLSFFICGGG